MEGSNAKQQSVCDTLSQWVQKERLYRSEVLLAINDIIDYNDYDSQSSRGNNQKVDLLLTLGSQ